MIRALQIKLWSLVAELEYLLYPWKTKQPPEWAVQRYNLDHGITDDHEDMIYYNWIKAHDERIGRLQSEMIHIQNEVKRLNQELSNARSE